MAAKRIPRTREKTKALVRVKWAKRISPNSVDVTYEHQLYADGVFRLTWHNIDDNGRPCVYEPDPYSVVTEGPYSVVTESPNLRAEVMEAVTNAVKAEAYRCPLYDAIMAVFTPADCAALQGEKVFLFKVA